MVFLHNNITFPQINVIHKNSCQQNLCQCIKCSNFKLARNGSWSSFAWTNMSHIVVLEGCHFAKVYVSHANWRQTTKKLWLHEISQHVFGKSIPYHLHHLKVLASTSIKLIIKGIWSWYNFKCSTIMELHVSSPHHLQEHQIRINNLHASFVWRSRNPSTKQSIVLCTWYSASIT